MARGMTGFGEEDTGAGFSLTLGTVLGLRWFWLESPSFYRQSPVPVPDYPPPWDGQPPPLTGSTGYAYRDGVAEAVCNDRHPVTAEPGHEVPYPPCGCGFWGYWTPEAAGTHPVGTNKLPVLGVVEATGRVIHGERGFRAQKCRIAALWPGVEISASHAPITKPRQAVLLRTERAKVWADVEALVKATRTGGTHYPRFLQLITRLAELDGQIAEAEKPDTEREERYRQAAADWSLAWQAAIEEALTAHYPSARIYSSQEAMLANHPPGKGYLSE